MENNQAVAKKAEFQWNEETFRAYWNGKDYGDKRFITVTNKRTQKSYKGEWSISEGRFPFGKGFGQATATGSYHDFELHVLEALGF